MDIHLLSHIGKLRFQAFQKGATLGTTFDEDVLVEQRLNLKCEAGRAFQKRLRFKFSHVREKPVLWRLLLVITPDLSISCARKSINVELLKPRIL